MCVRCVALHFRDDQLRIKFRKNGQWGQVPVWVAMGSGDSPRIMGSGDSPRMGSGDSPRMVIKTTITAGVKMV